MQRATVVFTTIFDPTILENYYRNFQKYGHLDQVEVIVIPDKKTPQVAWDRCLDVTKRGMRADCPSLDEQAAFLNSLNLPPEFIPYNSDNRRNVGYLMALQRDCDFVISLDDDNYARDDEDAFHVHSIVAASRATHEVIDSPTGFFNICDLLEFEDGNLPIYPRGYPYRARHQNEVCTKSALDGEIHINAGLWLLDPDIDALTWLVANPHVKAFQGESRVLAPRTWSPINTQNTGLRSDALSAYYFIRMGYPMSGTTIDRYGDIFSGYFIQACAKHLGGLVRAGSPVADHRRNAHNYMRDASMEWGAILVLEDVLPWLREVRLSGNCYIETFRCLAAELHEAAEQFRGPAWNDSTRGFLHQTAYLMGHWADACQKIAGNRGGSVH